MVVLRSELEAFGLKDFEEDNDRKQRYQPVDNDYVLLEFGDVLVHPRSYEVVQDHQAADH